MTVPLCAADVNLRGRVVDENDAPVAGARVTARPPRRRILFTTSLYITYEFHISVALHWSHHGGAAQ
jgi:hypothetical protein